MHGLQGTEFLLRTPQGEAPCKLPLPGRHNISNALAAAGVGSWFGLQPALITSGLANVSLTEMRQELKKGIRGSTIVDDTYNASPASVKAALRLLADVTDRERTVAVLGNMYELGTETVSGHRAVGEYAAVLQIDYLIAVGDLAVEIARGARDAGLSEDRIGVFDDNRQAIAFLKDFVSSGDLVLIKGSRVARMEEIVATLSEGGLR
jgi:UDP-N-acetylmuramoyl-tripeptide--D-alanyl-D-alanine ligase